MSRKLQMASALALAATLTTALVGTTGSGAEAQSVTPAPAQVAAQAETDQSAQPAFETFPQQSGVIVDGQVAEPLIDPVRPSATSLAALVSSQPQLSELSRELNCLAGAVYFEAKSESLAGQLAVGRVVVARSKSGRFPNSYCGVVFQRSQFSFVRGNSMPAIPKASRQWKNAVAIAQIAHEGTWRSPAEGALFFHATHVSPRWGKTRLARVDNHIFYR
jgi:spore germination cell wall hydrolase CwlJ-like protein